MANVLGRPIEIHVVILFDMTGRQPERHLLPFFGAYMMLRLSDERL